MLKYEKTDCKYGTLEIVFKILSLHSKYGELASLEYDNYNTKIRSLDRWSLQGKPINGQEYDNYTTNLRSLDRWRLQAKPIKAREYVRKFPSNSWYDLSSSVGFKRIQTRLKFLRTNYITTLYNRKLQ